MFLLTVRGPSENIDWVYGTPIYIVACMKRYGEKKAADEACHDIIGVLYPVYLILSEILYPYISQHASGD